MGNKIRSKSYEKEPSGGGNNVPQASELAQYQGGQGSDRNREGALRASIKAIGEESQQNKCCQDKMLLVDDSDFNLQIVIFLIKELFEIELQLASDGLQAFNAFKEAYEKECGCQNRGYRLIFMDINMPVMDGYESTQKILAYLKERGDEDYTHIVALSSFEGESVMKRCLQVGMKDKLTKPLHSSDLQRIIYEHHYRIAPDEYEAKFP